MNLSEKIAEAVAPLFEALPLKSAMPHLVGSNPSHVDVMQSLEKHPMLSGRPELLSALWLYVSDLDRSHTISQSILTTTGSYLHGIMHRREGDFSNSRYWMRRAVGHPLLLSGAVPDPDDLVDRVAAARGTDLPELVELQRQEWQAVFEYCAGLKDI